MDALRHYREVWAVDFEFTAPTGCRPRPLCVVARELRGRRPLVRQWLDDPHRLPLPRRGGGLAVRRVLFISGNRVPPGARVALPVRVLDLYAEFACLTSGTRPPFGRSLLGALSFFGLPAIDAAEKEEFRELAMRGGTYRDVEKERLLDYCQSDVDSLARLLPAMLPRIDLPSALLRGRYAAAAARMEDRGTPIDLATLRRLRRQWGRIKSRLVSAVNARYGVSCRSGD